MILNNSLFKIDTFERKIISMTFLCTEMLTSVIILDGLACWLFGVAENLQLFHRMMILSVFTIVSGDARHLTT